MTAPHLVPFRVYYEDTDFSGFVYHANYLRFLERARTEFLRALGITQSTLHRDEAGLVFVVTRLTIDYLRPARMDDMIEVATTVGEVRGPLVRLVQEVRRGDETLVRAEVSIVAVRAARVVRLPAGLRAAFQATMGDAAVSPP
jgi:acyl-CoA thioester hydrolase